MARLMETITQYGWMTTGVAEFTLSYTIGLMSGFNHPEILIHGLPAIHAHGFMNLIVAKLKAGEKFETGKRYAHLTQNFDTMFIEVHPANHDEWMGMGKTINTEILGVPQRAIQLVWTDTKGKFPWEPGFEERFRDKQLLFDKPQPYPETDGECHPGCACHESNAETVN